MTSKEKAAPVAAKRRASTSRAKRVAQNLPPSLPSRVVIRSVEPSVDGGRFAAKRVIGESTTVTAVAFADGHDHLAVELLWRKTGEAEWNRTPMTAGFNDLWSADFVPSAAGPWEFCVEAYIDRYDTWLSGLEKLLAASRVTESELLDGSAQLHAAAERCDSPAERAALEDAAGVVAAAAPADAFAAAQSVHVEAQKWQDRGVIASSGAPIALLVERERAGNGAWYELFPRSTGQPGSHGTLRDVQRMLPDIAAMGFDVLYLPPIHPIGSAHRKGPNNTLTPADGDPGSPWAIGSAEGGHTEIHPELGTLDDFAALVASASEYGMEIALDIAFQCSPDHPMGHRAPGMVPPPA